MKYEIPSRVGLIAGEGKLPIILAKNAREEGVEVSAVGIKGKTNKKLRKYVEDFHLVKLGQLNELVQYFKNRSLKKVVMAGKVPKIHLFDKVRFAMDKELVSLLEEVKDKKDDSLLKAVANYLQQRGLVLLDSTLWLKELLPEKGILTKSSPTDREKEDVEFGKKIAKNIAGLDIGQTVVIKEKAVLAVEAIEHTDKTIIRGGKLGNGGVVVVKVSRPEQDMRFDIPVVGLRTIKILRKAKANVLAVESGKTLFIEKEKIVNTADKAGISIVAV